ncbi:MAG: hypothetical protein AAB726_00015 [Patescibacteria group bacterium]
MGARKKYRKPKKEGPVFKLTKDARFFRRSEGGGSRKGLSYHGLIPWGTQVTLGESRTEHCDGSTRKVAQIIAPAMPQASFVIVDDLE